ncbi:unnamed protein product [Angiostrongylus costaricensis]|uniref:C-type lectin domain-containing protein n=1 Tax=Angiostrongylus costaricensis TaxID=334426 RepID=A0A0R3PXC7_ANGCS|nr:unnamed protein product [Angiostrongylus costaricensis]
MTVAVLLLALFATLHNPITSVVIPPQIRPKFNSTPGKRAANLDYNIRLLTVLSLQQNGWHLYDEYWYRLFEVDLMWIPAENFCRSMGGHLVSIKDEAENDFVNAIRKKSNIWIGLNKIDDPQQIYKWSDGSAADFLNWDSTQPNEPKVDCAYMAYHQEHRGTWFDYGCHEMLPQYFVCKLPTP